jgi:hypothetical protein
VDYVTQVHFALRVLLFLLHVLWEVFVTHSCSLGQQVLVFLASFAKIVQIFQTNSLAHLVSIALAGQVYHYLAQMARFHVLKET